MPTKTTTKSAARKPATSARKTVKAAAPKESAAKSKPKAAEKAEAPAKAKQPAAATAPAHRAAPARKPEATHKPAHKPAHKPVAPAAPRSHPTSARSHPAKPAPPAAPPEPPKPPRQPMATVSLIDEKKPKVRPPEGTTTTGRRTVLPPISRIMAPATPSLRPPPVTPPPAPAPAAVETPAAPTPAADESSENGVAPEAEGEPQKIIHIKPPIIVRELASALSLKPFQLIKQLMELNVFANQNQTIEPDVATKICETHGFVFEVERREKGGGVHKVVEVVAAPPPPVLAKEEELKPRPPIITFMGHVDHGKTSLMDAIRKTSVAAGEAGGITQHVGAYTVEHKGEKITFIDTPGHAAFTAMRARGANVTDIVVLVVAADDGLMPQTIEAINHAKAATHVKIMVAINKIDLPSANVDRVKKQLQERELMPEDWGGETIVCEVSATKGTGIDHLLEMMTLQAEVMELKASPTAKPRGTVIEAQVDAGRGPTASVIVQMGTLKLGDPFICGDYGGKVKSLMDPQGKAIKEAGPGTPAKVLGFNGLPLAGDEFLVMNSEREAKTLSEERLTAKRTEKLSAPQRATLETLLEAADGKKILRIVLKCDAQGSLEALVGTLDQIESKKIDLEIVHSAVGPVSESDILLASASNAVVVGFNIKVENMAVSAAKREGVQIKLYSIIYELIDQMKDSMAEMLDPEHRETVIGHAEVKQVFQLSRGIVAGCLVTDGRIARTARARVLRRRQPVYDGGLATLRRFQDDVKEVRSGLECGIKLGDYSEYQAGDIIECYQLEQVAQKL